MRMAWFALHHRPTHTTKHTSPNLKPNLLPHPKKLPTGVAQQKLEELHVPLRVLVALGGGVAHLLERGHGGAEVQVVGLFVWVGFGGNAFRLGSIFVGWLWCGRLCICPRTCKHILSYININIDIHVHPSLGQTHREDEPAVGEPRAQGQLHCVWGCKCVSVYVFACMCM